MIRKFKWLIIFLVLLYLVVFITSNNQTVKVNYIWNKPLFGYKHPTKQEVKEAEETGQPVPESSDPREIPLMILLFIAFLLGIFASSISGTLDRYKFKSNLRREKKALKIEKKNLDKEFKEKEKEIEKKQGEVESNLKQNQVNNSEPRKG
ncbi:MAG: hypothetical protein A2161_09335 [Candidatus Schekmanbacteria bacterium RBG_13_48_7]|uniref:Lipopolysaccharide assembly protein A domain-containing protein n=1 Tax=Candidatus Schekmanbacteria bacterium RBG_13_48_7 TaxID=1817878 RepID=A0A1F7S134_9BACT|nr:MAG: hypothetical protein A2161_09335 [Candidatus Schekmanbacteria bacterium RBG_13_48_7]